MEFCTRCNAGCLEFHTFSEKFFIDSSTVELPSRSSQSVALDVKNDPNQFACSDQKANSDC